MVEMATSARGLSKTLPLASIGDSDREKVIVWTSCCGLIFHYVHRPRALRLVTASARRANVAPPTWHRATRDERERATLERLRQLPPGDVDVVDATLGRLRLERQVAEALAAIGMDQPGSGQP